MRKNLFMMAFALLTLAMTACYDDDNLWNKVDELETKVEANAADIATLSALVDALNQGKIITGTEQTENGYVLIFNDNSRVEVLNGKDGKNGEDGISGENGDSFFTSVEEKGDLVIITLADGRVIELPKVTYRILTFEDEDAKFSPYTLYGGAGINTWSDLIDDQQYGGSLTYTDFMEDVYYWNDENHTELKHSFITPYWGGGHVISNYKIEDYKTLPEGKYGWYELQMSIPIDGHNGSKNFCVHNGYKDTFNSSIYDASLVGFEFPEGIERTVDHMYVTNTSYVLNSITYGDGFNQPATDDTYMKIIAYGYDANDRITSTTEFYLCNTGKKLVTDWQKWDLSSLGKVNRIVFNIEASEDQSGSYGLNCPAYFAYDDVAVRF